jgi:hypothetical protein
MKIATIKRRLAMVSITLHVPKDVIAGMKRVPS